ncbi:MAG: OmpA family protein [Alphaproteobacteria bacterium]|jgi:outer membrane protein OmpA-like peptidoglycan-associated protein|nr:OmpA family protein [Alphaproteobacteria bacterium]
MRKFSIVIFSVLLLASCAAYKSPDHSMWQTYLRGASFTDMTENARTAKKPIFQGAGGKTVSEVVKQSVEMEYGDPAQNESAMYVGYMSGLENELYDALRRPGLSVQRAGTDVLVILVRDAIMELNAPEISADGDDNLSTIVKILKKYDATFVEIAGYTDSMRDTNAARAFSLDMAERVGVYFAAHGIKTSRMFIVGRGAARPIAAQDEWGRLANRRVELRISPVR